MSEPVRTTITYYSQTKDGFGWAIDAGTTPGWLLADWRAMITDGSIYAYDTFTTMLVGRKHTRYKNSNPPESWERLRAYTSFYTSGYLAGGYVESAKLRIYMQRCDGFIVGPNGLNPQSQQSDWSLDVYSVSGGPGAVQQVYTSGFNPGNYGFGDQIDHYEDDLFGQGINYDAWGEISWPLNSSAGVLEERVGMRAFSVMATDPEAVALNTSPIDGKTTGFRGWIEIPISLTAINNLGETHFRLVHRGESEGALPIAGGGTTTNHEYASIETDESSREPELIVTYVQPAFVPINDLRIVDLSFNRHLQTSLDLDTTYSGVRILDGFPDDPLRLSAERNISLEHVSTITESYELGSRKTKDKRRFFIDIVCDRRGELLDLQQKVRSLLSGGAQVYDFRYGFDNPPSMGRMAFDNLTSFDIPPLTVEDTVKYHTIFSIDAITVKSG